MFEHAPDAQRRRIVSCKRSNGTPVQVSRIPTDTRRMSHGSFAFAYAAKVRAVWCRGTRLGEARGELSDQGGGLFDCRPAKGESAERRHGQADYEPLTGGVLQAGRRAQITNGRVTRS